MVVVFDVLDSRLRLFLLCYAIHLIWPQHADIGTTSLIE